MDDDCFSLTEYQSASFDFVDEDDLFQDSVLLKPNDSYRMLGNGSKMELGSSCVFESDSEESNKSFSLLNEFEVDVDTSDNISDLQVVSINNDECDYTFEKSHKAIQTETWCFEEGSPLKVMKDAAFIESYITIKSFLNFNLESKIFYDILADYLFKFRTEADDNSKYASEIIPLDLNLKNVSGIKNSFPVEKENLTVKRKIFPGYNYSLRSQKSQESIESELVSEEADSWEYKSCFNFTPELRDELESFNCNNSDFLPVSSKDSERNILQEKNVQVNNYVKQTIFNAEIFMNSLTVFLTHVEHMVIRQGVTLGQIWKNSSIENGVKIISQMAECSIGQLNVQGLVFNFFKKIMDSFFDERASKGNHELEYKAVFLIVACDSPCFYFDLINYSIQIVYHQSFSWKDLIRIPEALCFVCRVLKALLEKFHRDLKSNFNDLPISVEESQNVTVFDFWKDTWKTSKPEKRKSYGLLHDFKMMLNQWLTSLDDVLTLCLADCVLMSLMISECKSLVLAVIEIISKSF